MRNLKKRWIAVGLVLLASLPLYAAEYSFESAGPVPADGVAEAVRSAVESEGVRVKGPDGAVVSEVWARKTPFEGEPVAGFGIRFDTIPEGAFLGLIRFATESSDFREQGIPAGIYTLRYGLHPEDGNHMGVAPSRDFAVLTPAAEDTDPAKNYSYSELVSMSRKTGNPHPSIARVQLPEGDEAPHLWENEYGNWVLDLTMGGETVGLVVWGHSEE